MQLAEARGHLHVEAAAARVFRELACGVPNTNGDVIELNVQCGSHSA
jgi:hypothetical protein